MNVVILIALLSAMNANVYGSSRMAHSLVSRGQGPKALGKVSGRVPRRAVLASCGFGFVTVLLSYWYPDTLFAWLLNMVGGVILVVWGFIAVSQFVLRRRLEREAPEKLVVKMWGFPYLTWVALAGVAGVLVLMVLGEDTRLQVVFTGGLTLALAATGYVMQRRAAARA